MMQPTRALLLSAQRANRLLALAYARQLSPTVTVRDAMSVDGVDAILVDEGLGDGDTLLLPGTGYGDGPRESWTDWWRNAISIIPSTDVRRALDPHALKTPATGTSGVRWAKGFLDGACAVVGWLGDRQPVRAAGHSQGGAILQIVHWSRFEFRGHIMQSHAIAPARPCFDSMVMKHDDLNCWVAPDDQVPRVPYGARHVGLVHEMPRCTSPGWWADFHTPEAYDRRFAQMLAGCGA